MTPPSERNLPVPVSNDGRIVLSNRRSLTTVSEANPTRHEFGSLIPLEPDEARQIVAWANSAMEAIQDVGLVLSNLPGETTTAHSETIGTQSQQHETSSAETFEETKIKGFFTISINSLKSTRGSRGISSRGIEQRSGESTARTRPGQFLSGSHVKDALDRAAIARGEGLLYLPAASAELDRRQNAVVETTRRLVLDYGRGNTSWSEDIQDGLVTGLIGQLNQAVSLYKNGYAPESLKEDLSENALQTLDEEVREALVTAFRHLLRATLINVSSLSALESAAQALKQTISAEIFPLDSQFALALLNEWVGNLNPNVGVENARIIGLSYAEALYLCLAKAEDPEVFEQFADHARRSVGAGAGELLVKGFVEQNGQARPDAQTIDFYSLLVPEIKPDSQADFDITLLRFSLAVASQNEDFSTVSKILNRISNHGKGGRFIVGMGDFKVRLGLIQKLTTELSEDEWKQIVSLLRDEGGDWIVEATQMGIEKVKISDIKDDEIVAAIRDFFVRQIRAGTQEQDYGSLLHSERGNLGYMYSQCDLETRMRIRQELEEIARQRVEETRQLIDQSGNAMRNLASDQTLVSRVDKFASVPDEKIIKALDSLSRGQSVSDREALDAAQSLLDRLYRYKDMFHYMVPSTFSAFNPIDIKRRERTRENMGELTTVGYFRLREHIGFIVQVLKRISEADWEIKQEEARAVSKASNV